jgi:hypothetical protein
VKEGKAEKLDILLQQLQLQLPLRRKKFLKMKMNLIRRLLCLALLNPVQLPRKTKKSQKNKKT